MHPLDAALLLGFVALSLWQGFRARRVAGRSLDEYFLAGRRLPGWQAGASMAATQFAADTPLLVTGLLATAGVFGLWRLWVYALAFLMLGFLLAPCWRGVGVVTDAELAELRYGGRPARALRVVKAVYFGVVFNCTVLAMVLWAAKEVVEPFLTWHAWLPAAVFGPWQALVEAVGVPFAREAAGSADLWVRSADNALSLGLLVAVTWTYSATGGLRSVVRTDLAQLALMLGGTAAYAFLVVQGCGGLGPMLAAVRELPDLGPARLAFTPGEAGAGGVVLGVLALQWLVQMNADGTGYLAQRTMACRSDRDATVAALVFTGLQVVLRSLLWLPLGLGLLVLFPPGSALEGSAWVADREASYVRGMAELLPVGVRGLLLTAMLAALASTIDSHLNWGASYLSNDLYRLAATRLRGREPSPRQLVRVARLASLVLLAVAAVVMTRLTSIQFAWHASLLLGAGMGVMLVLRWLWWRVNAWGELAAACVSLVAAPLLLGFGPADEGARLLVMASLSTVAGIAASLATAPEAPAQLARFAARARPPGFWGRHGSPDGPLRLARGAGATAAAAVTTFGSLMGIGGWLLGSPAPFGLGAPAFAVLCLALAAAAVPLWWRWGALGRRA